MTTFEVSRTLVKSPPEVWAELEQAERLGELLGDEAITITKTDPERSIEWAGGTGHGTIEIEGSSWGTKVRLTAEPIDVSGPAADVETVCVAEDDQELAADSEEVSTSAKASTPAVTEQPSEPAHPDRQASAIVQTAADVEIEATVEAGPAPPSYWRRVKAIFGGSAKTGEPAEVGGPPEPGRRTEADESAEPDSAGDTGGSAQTPASQEIVEPAARTEEPAEAGPTTRTEESAEENSSTSDHVVSGTPAVPATRQPVADSEPAPPNHPVDLEQRLTALLDHLGSAHKRPFTAA
ncbi:MAG: hypothetical protein WAO61_05345 [Solirubrobacterales bacterium]